MVDVADDGVCRFGRRNYIRSVRFEAAAITKNTRRLNLTAFTAEIWSSETVIRFTILCTISVLIPRSTFQVFNWISDTNRCSRRCAPFILSWIMMIIIVGVAVFILCSVDLNQIFKMLCIFIDDVWSFYSFSVWCITNYVRRIHQRIGCSVCHCLYHRYCSALRTNPICSIFD